MNPALIGSLVSAGTSLLGGFLNRREASREVARQDMAAQRNIDMQREFAKQGIRWRVADAKAAGVHPLYALGANTATFSPVRVGDAPGSGFGDAIAGAGQNIGRAVSAMQTPSERVADRLKLENMSLQNDLLRSQIARNAALMVGTGPGMPGHVDPGSIPDATVHEPRPQLRFGGKWLTHPEFSSGQQNQDRYGDEGPVSWFAGVPPLIADVLLNLGALNDWSSRYVSRRSVRRLQYERR